MGEERFTPEELKQLVDAGELTTEYLSLLHPADAKVGLKFLLDAGRVEAPEGGMPLPPFLRSMSGVVGQAKGIGSKNPMGSKAFEGSEKAIAERFEQSTAAGNAARSAQRAAGRGPAVPPGASGKNPKGFLDASNKFFNKAYESPAELDHIRKLIQQGLDKPVRTGTRRRSPK